MVKQDIKKKIKELARGDISEEEFQKYLDSLKTRDGANWYSISGAISGVLGNSLYEEEFCRRVRRLAIEVDERFEQNLGIT